MSDTQIPISSEANSPTLTTSPVGYTPTDDERKALKLVNRLYDKAKAHRKKYDRDWLDNYHMFRGKQWKEQRPTYRHSEVINFVFQAIQSMVPIQTDSRPRFDYLPQEPQDMQLAQILSDLATSDWERGNWLLTLTEACYDAHIYGTSLSSMEFDPKADFGAGKIQYRTADPFYCFPDPSALDVNERSKSFIYAEPLDVETLKSEFPSKAQWIKADLVDLGNGDKNDLGQMHFKSPVDSKTILDGSSPLDQGKRQQALKITCYVYDQEYNEEEKKEAQADGTESVKFVQSLKYPKGRKICISSGVVLSDGPIPYDDGLFPYARLVNYILPREFWGMSEVEQLKSPQRTFNKLVSFALDVLTLMGNPVWKVGTGAGVDTDNLINRPGLIIEAEDISQIQREEGVQLQPFVLQLIDRMADWFQEISGRTDVTQGSNPGGVTAASAITALQEAAQTRMRLKSRNLDCYLQNLGQLYMSRVFQFYTAPKVFRLTANPESQKFFKFHIEDRQVETGEVEQVPGPPVMDEMGQPAPGPMVEQPVMEAQKVAIIRDFVQNPETGAYSESLEAREFPVKGSFDVRVTTGSALPFAKAERVATAKMFFEAGAMSPLDFLKAADYPNAEAIWQRKQEFDAQMAQQQAMMAPPMAGGGAPPDPGLTSPAA